MLAHPNRGDRGKMVLCSNNAPYILNVTPLFTVETVNVYAVVCVTDICQKWLSCTEHLFLTVPVKSFQTRKLSRNVGKIRNSNVQFMSVVLLELAASLKTVGGRLQNQAVCPTAKYLHYIFRGGRWQGSMEDKTRNAKRKPNLSVSYAYNDTCIKWYHLTLCTR